VSESDEVGEAKIAPDADQMKENTSRDKRDALFEWEDDGGARRTDVGGQRGAARAPGERRRSERQGLDATHDSDLRGEHQVSPRSGWQVGIHDRGSSEGRGIAR
jgi:hypothetical protein